jgi:primosomal protein N'
LKCFRDHHSMVNRHVCQHCGNVSRESTNKGCVKCGSHHIKTRVVIEKCKIQEAT